MREYLKRERLARLKSNLKRDLKPRYFKATLIVNGKEVFTFDPATSNRGYTSIFSVYNWQNDDGYMIEPGDHVKFRVKNL